MLTENSPYPPKKVGLAPNLDSGFYGQDIISVSQFTKESLDYICGVAEEMRAIVKRAGATDLLKGTVLACLFYEPSTRTSASFIAAMSRLGGTVIPITQGVQFSSVAKGESLPDTIRTLESYADMIVLRRASDTVPSGSPSRYQPRCLRAMRTPGTRP